MTRQHANYWTRQPFGRRTLLRTAGGAALGAGAFALAGCGGDDDDGSSDGSKLPEGAVAPAQTQTTATAKKGGTIKFAHTADADHFDSVLETTWLQNLGPHIYSKLLRWDAKVEQLMPDLAAALPEATDGGLTYIFKLRPDLKWSDGSAITSEDIAFTLLRIRDTKASPHRYKVGPLDSVETPDTTTVKVKLSKPFAPFVSFMGTAWLFMQSKKFVTAKGEKFQEALGSGPYVISARQPGVSTQFKRNPLHWNSERPYPDGLDFRVIPDISTFDAAVIAGELDFAASLNDKARVDAIMAANKDIVDLTHAAHHWNMFIMNNEVAFKDKRLRQAMNLLIDRELYGKIVHSTGAKPSGPITWGFSKYAYPQDKLAVRPGYRKDKTQDIKDAKDLLAAAGFASGLKLQTATTTPAAHATYNAGALALKDQLVKYGVELDLGITDMAGIQAKRGSGNYDCMVYVNGGSQEIDEHIFGPNRTGEARNVNRFSNADIDALLDKQRVTLDEAARKAIIMEAQEKLLEELPTAWLADPVYHSLHNKRLVAYAPWLVFDRSSELYDTWIRS